MSNLVFNIRFGSYHFQMTRDWHFGWIRNAAHDKPRPPNFKWFAVYCAFGKHFT